MVGEENEILFIRVWKPFPDRPVLKLEEKLERENPKRTISVSGEIRLGLLQMVSEPDTAQCTNKEAQEALPRRG